MSFVRRISTIASSSIASQIIGALSIWLISTRYGMSEVGVYALTYSVALIGAQICTLASQLLLPKQNDSLLGQNFVFCLCLSALLAVIYALITSWYLEHSIIQVYLLTLSHAWILVSENMLLRDQKVRQLAVQRTSISVLVFALVYLTQDSATFYWAWSLGVALWVLVCIVIVAPTHQLSRHQCAFQSLWLFFSHNKHHLIKVGGAETLAMLNANLPVVLLNVWFSPTVAGYYAVVQRFCLSPVVIAGNAVRNTIFAEWSHSFRQNYFDYDKFIKVRNLLLVIGVAATLGVYVFYPLVMRIGFNEEWLASVPTSRYMLPYLLPALAVCPLTVLELIYGHPNYFLRIQLEQFAVVLIAFGALPLLSVDYSYCVLGFAILSALRYAFIYRRVHNTAKHLKLSPEGIR